MQAIWYRECGTGNVEVGIIKYRGYGTVNMAQGIHISVVDEI